MSFWSMWEPRKTVGQRRAEAARKIQDAARRGTPMAPVVLAGRKIAQTFWGKAWCDNLERYRDYANRLDRGRSYVRSGSVIDLQIHAGRITAQVSGSSDYEIEIVIEAVARPAWLEIQRGCAGSIGSRLDLLAGRLSDAVMARLCADRTGLFPAPAAIRFNCSCPDYATMCKHVAAVMYGIAARLDQSPELLFTLREVSADELIASALSDLPATPSPGRVLATGGLSALFGIELADAPPVLPASKRTSATKPAAAKLTAAKPTAAKPTAAKPAAAKPAAAKPAAAKPTAAKRPTAKPTKAIAKPVAARPAKSAKPTAKRAAQPTAKRSEVVSSRTARPPGPGLQRRPHP